MFKTTFTPRIIPQEEEYPLFRIYHDDSFIVMFTDKCTGIVVWAKPGMLKRRAGEFDDAWETPHNKSVWKPVSGTVTWEF